MATGYSRSIEGGHDVIYDYCCTTCEGENLNAEALHYCKDCSQLFCEPCKEYHDKFFKTHQALGRAELAKWGDAKPVTLSLMCDEHPGKELEMYCRDHGCVSCHICISVRHSCREVKPVSHVSKVIQQNPEFKSLLSEAINTKSRLKTMHDKQENNIKMLQKTRGEITFTFKNMRKKFNQMVDKLEEESTKEMDRLLKLFKEQVTTDKDACSDLLNKIQKLLHDIQTLGKQCDELAFQGYKKCSEQMTSAEKLLSSIQDQDYKLKFTPDVSIEQHLSSLESLGSFQAMPCDFADKLATQTEPLNPPDHVYSIVNKQTYNVKTSKDKNKCYITGICQLPGRQIAIADKKNCKVKLLSTYTYRVLDELELPPRPVDICHTRGTDIAVTVLDSFRDRHEIQFINAGNGKMSYTRTVQLDHCCYGIAYHNGQLYVGSGDALYAYNLSGKKIKKLYELGSSSLSSNVKRFSLSHDGSKIYLANKYNSLLTLDGSGNELSMLGGLELQDPEGFCVADNGAVFVCGPDLKKSNKLHMLGIYDKYKLLQLDSEGRTDMITLVRGLSEVLPESIFYDRKTQTLLIGEKTSNLLAFQLK